jgi:hypothetical protein
MRNRFLLFLLVIPLSYLLLSLILIQIMKYIYIYILRDFVVFKFKKPFVRFNKGIIIKNILFSKEHKGGGIIFSSCKEILYLS